jgi:ArsR family transcriptional regulator
VSVESLQKIFRILGDPTRVRILYLLEREELAVQELMDVLGMAQSRVSRHLGILREAGLLQDRRDGTFVLYRFASPEDAAWADAWSLAKRCLAEDPATARDLATLSRVLDARSARTRSFFDTVGPEWDAIRKVWGDDVLRARALTRLVPPDLCVVDVGTGTGVLALELAAAGLRVIAVDHSEAMLAAAARKVAEGGHDRVELRQGEATALPLADDEADAAFAHMVLQYLEAPAVAIAEMVRVVRPGGTLVIVDFVTHDRTWMRQELGVARLGTEPDDVARWLEEAGAEQITIERSEPITRNADLPDTFVASGRVAGESA